jgi:hypothetical protein
MAARAHRFGERGSFGTPTAVAAGIGATLMAANAGIED